MKTRSLARAARLLITSLWLAGPCQALQLDERLDAFVADESASQPAPESVAEPATAAAAGDDVDRSVVTRYVRAKLGAPYRFGAAGGRQGFDCSGLILRAYEAAGRAVPRVSKEQLQAGAPVTLDALKAGDLLFYRMRPNAPERLHVVMYVGDGRAIHASVTHRVVREIDVTRSVWSQRFVAARRLI